MLKKNQTTHVRSERNVLALAKTDWIIDLKVSFQDEKFLYLVMEYLAGGDLMTMLIKRDNLETTKHCAQENFTPMILVIFFLMEIWFIWAEKIV